MVDYLHSIDCREGENCQKEFRLFAKNKIDARIEREKSDITSIKSSDVCRPEQDDTSWIGIRETEGGIPK